MRALRWGSGLRPALNTQAMTAGTLCRLKAVITDAFLPLGALDEKQFQGSNIAELRASMLGFIKTAEATTTTDFGGHLGMGKVPTAQSASQGSVCAVGRQPAGLVAVFTRQSQRLLVCAWQV